MKITEAVSRRMLASDYPGISIGERETATFGVDGSNPSRCDYGLRPLGF